MSWPCCVSASAPAAWLKRPRAHQRNNTENHRAVALSSCNGRASHTVRNHDKKTLIFRLRVSRKLLTKRARVTRHRRRKGSREAYTRNAFRSRGMLLTSRAMRARVARVSTSKRGTRQRLTEPRARAFSLRFDRLDGSSPRNLTSGATALMGITIG